MELGIFRDSVANKWGDGNNYALQKRIEHSIISARATIIQRRYDSTKIFPTALVERVTCEDLIIAPDCTCSTDSGIVFKVVRTSRKVPNPLIIKDDSYFVFVGRGTKSFSFVPFHQIQDVPYRRFSDRQIFYSYFNDYVYIIGANALKEIDLAYVPENLIRFLKFGKCQDSGCINKDKIYIEDSLVEGIEALLETRKPIVMSDKSNAEILDE